MTKQMNKKGTSLVELIAVIVIMGIIAAVAVPTTISVIGRQKKKAAKSSIQGCEDAAQTLLLEGDTTVVSAAGLEGYTYYITVKALVTAGELKSNPIDAGDTVIDTLAFAISSNNKIVIGTEADSKFSLADATNGVSFKINGQTVTAKNNATTGVIDYTVA